MVCYATDCMLLFDEAKESYLEQNWEQNWEQYGNENRKVASDVCRQTVLGPFTRCFRHKQCLILSFPDSFLFDCERNIKFLYYPLYMKSLARYTIGTHVK